MAASLCLSSVWRDSGPRGYVVHYRPGCHCPGCGRSHWYVGRVSAECGFCETAIPLAPERRAA